MRLHGLGQIDTSPSIKGYLNISQSQDYLNLGQIDTSPRITCVNTCPSIIGYPNISRDMGLLGLRTNRQQSKYLWILCLISVAKTQITEIHITAYRYIKHLQEDHISRIEIQVGGRRVNSAFKCTYYIGNYIKHFNRQQVLKQ